MEKRVVCAQRLEDADVAVIGGGTAGCFAAIAAAASGARTVLIEKNAALGGTITTGGVNFPGLFYAWGQQIIDGPCWRVIQEVAQLGGAVIPDMNQPIKTHWKMQIRLNPFLYEQAVYRMCREYQVKIRLHSMLAGATETETGAEMLLAEKDGLKLLSARRVIDATGDANLVSMLGYPVEKSESLQPATLAAWLAGYSPEVLQKESLLPMLKKAEAEGKLPLWMTGEKAYGILEKGWTDFHISCPENADSSAGKTLLEQDARAQIEKYLSCVRQLPGLEKIFVSHFAGECGVRETVRIQGEYQITRQDYISGRRLEDAVCYAFYPVDLHVPQGVFPEQLQPGIVPSVPYRALIPKNSRFLLACGRCISSDTQANSALRVQATCMAEGQAAGCAAALAARMDCDMVRLPYADLCAQLKNIGAIIPS
ncbi:MAG: FAD-dependent oxidoreductase [Clostridia bacterium]|nr:FAD-dependent oxidoreductase [Clostridia bacterium]